MRVTQLVATCLLALASTTRATQIPQDHILWGPGGSAAATLHNVRRATSSVAPSSTSKAADAACTNGPTSRNCWSGGYSVLTDFDKKWPTTGNTVSYTLTVTNTTCNPDGNGPRICFLYNGQYPGPTITADWGDTVQVTVINKLTGNGTVIHWHGIRQLNTNIMDGVNGITECPVAPGDTKVYTWKATQFGTTWYHSHYSSQYGDGLIGAIQINGPASANYDVDLGTYPVNDWYYSTADQLNVIASNNLQSGQAPPPADTLLVNGKNKSPGGAGAYDQVTLTKGKKYRLRLINTSVDNNIRVSLDNHQLQVITSDLVPIKPYYTNWVLLAIGQRYDVIIYANQTVANYWFRAEVATDCASSNNFYGRSIFSYTGATSGDPTTTAFTSPSGGCVEDKTLVPWVTNTVSSSDFLKQVSNLQVDLTVEQVTTNGQNIVVWGVNVSAIDVDWRKPTLQYVKDGNTSYPAVYNLIELPTEGIWTYWIIQETPGTNVPIPHPIHLHGHDFYVLGTGSGTFDINSSPSTLTWANPTRRDVALLPGGGWLAIAFPTDNPGAWLMHCHIAWHISEGLGVQFLEAKSQITLPGSDWDTQCTDWKTYYENPVYEKIDSGL
ncbi:putative multicopper oxidase, type 1 [Mytilinidion resinicola]|uniref:laccase n=1 Tax=Mytilinidion resinicola TaxID=574789 RepID=A0A6A6YVN1_9PEZI|nr:putative multicopper oxidase, type 1 [Mytilinidion resinicola]KAF2812433.1 putative multicopper oxidase, type 1 [Mytilinidion resinicola]